MVSRLIKTKNEIINQYKNIETFLVSPEECRLLFDKNIKPITPKSHNNSNISGLQKIKQRNPMIFLK